MAEGNTQPGPDPDAGYSDEPEENLILGRWSTDVPSQELPVITFRPLPTLDEMIAEQPEPSGDEAVASYHAVNLTDAEFEAELDQLEAFLTDIDRRLDENENQ